MTNASRDVSGTFNAVKHETFIERIMIALAPFLLGAMVLVAPFPVLSQATINNELATQNFGSEKPVQVKIHTKQDKESCQSIAGKFSDHSGVIVFCEAIAEAWRDKLPGRQALKLDSGEEINVENAVVVDFPQPRGSEKGVIPSTSLARLLSAPNIIPPTMIGGIMLKNLVLTEPLTLNNATLNYSVRFYDAKLMSDPEKSDQSNDAAKPAKREVLSLKGVNFKKRIQFIGGVISGNVRIEESQFEGGLEFIDLKFEKPLENLIIANSTIRPELSFINTTSKDPGSEFKILKSHIGGFNLSGSSFGDLFDVQFNQIDNLFVYKSDFRDVVIQWNRFSGQVSWVAGKIKGAVSKTSEFPKFVPTFSANHIGSGLQFYPEKIGEKYLRLDLTYNRLNGYSEIRVPEKWTGQVDLSNVKVDGGLRLRLSKKDSIEPIVPNYKEEAYQDELVCKPFEHNEGILFDLTVSEVDILGWNIPLSCDVRWEGAGLKYQYWGDPDLKSWQVNPESIKNQSISIPTNDDFLKRYLRWRRVMAREDVDALSYMAEYLKLHGQFVASRDVLEEAKKLNYTLDKNRLKISNLQNENVAIQWERFKLGAIQLLLYPGGYGAKPERALIFIFGGWIFFGGIYWMYSQQRRCFTRHHLSSEQSSFLSGGRHLPDVPTYGFQSLDSKRNPGKFTVWRYSLDTILPVINLHAYDRFVIDKMEWRWIPALQHFLGWWWLTVFLASAAIL